MLLKMKAFFTDSSEHISHLRMKNNPRHVSAHGTTCGLNHLQDWFLRSLKFPLDRPQTIGQILRITLWIRLSNAECLVVYSRKPLVQHKPIKKSHGVRSFIANFDDHIIRCHGSMDGHTPFSYINWICFLSCRWKHFSFSIKFVTFKAFFKFVSISETPVRNLLSRLLLKLQSAPRGGDPKGGREGIPPKPL